MGRDSPRLCSEAAVEASPADDAEEPGLDNGGEIEHVAMYRVALLPARREAARATRRGAWRTLQGPADTEVPARHTTSRAMGVRAYAPLFAANGVARTLGVAMMSSVAAASVNLPGCDGENDLAESRCVELLGAIRARE